MYKSVVTRLDAIGLTQQLSFEAKQRRRSFEVDKAETEVSRASKNQKSAVGASIFEISNQLSNKRPIRERRIACVLSLQGFLSLMKEHMQSWTLQGFFSLVGRFAESVPHLKNRSPHSRHHKTRYEGWYGDKPDLAHIRTLGCKCYAKKTGQLEKLNVAKASLCSLLGYRGSHMVYLLLREDGAVVRSSNVMLMNSTAILRSATPLSPSRQPKDPLTLGLHTLLKGYSRRNVRLSLSRLSPGNKLTSHLKYSHCLDVRQPLLPCGLRPGEKSTSDPMVPSMT